MRRSSRIRIRTDRLIPNLAVEFQSKHDPKTNAIAGFEALTRLRSRRVINPGMIFSQLVDVDVESAATDVHAHLFIFEFRRNR